ncbi:MAG: thioredoxin family protein [Dissulfuribacterales bacterium]
MKKMFILAILSLSFMVFIASSGHAATSKELLSMARTKGIPAMLEVGSVQCIPCKQMKPILDKLEKQYKDRLQVIFVDIGKDEEKKVATMYGVFVIPTQIFLDKNGKEVARHVGFYPYEEIQKVLKQHFNLE